MIPLKINDTHLCQIFTPDLVIEGWSDAQIDRYSKDHSMYPSSVQLTSETYSRDAERTADYELENLTIVNRKAKPEFTWDLIRAEYVKNLFEFLHYDYDFKDASGIVNPRDSQDITISYYDFIGMRVITAYMGQTVEGTLVEHEGILYWENFRIAFPER